MTAGLGLPAPAKVNLSLRVLGRRADGHHELETLFCAIDLADELEIERRSRGTGITLEIAGTAGRGLPVAAGHDNLVVRAAAAVLERSGRDASLHFRLGKRIPAGGGLGGGSSDAAAALRLTNALLGRPLTDADLLELAPRLGADVAFFLFGGTCVGRGVGEVLVRVPEPPRLEFLLLLPPFGTPTADVFRMLGARLIAERQRVTVPRIEPPTATEIAAMLATGNELEDAAMRCVPRLRALRDAVRDLGAGDVRMSGSGSTLFVARQDAAELDRLRDEIQAGLAAVPAGAGVAVVRAGSFGPAPPPARRSRQERPDR